MYKFKSKKLLFVFSRDHGEIFNAFYFLAGNSFEAFFIMPDNLYQINKSTQLYPVLRYEQAADIFKAVESVRPDIILLFSGYLFIENKIFTYEQFELFLNKLREYKIPILTSDPWLQIGKEKLDNLNKNDPAQLYFYNNYWKTAKLLDNFPHLFTAPYTAKNSSITFFNKKLKLSKYLLKQLVSKYKFNLNQKQKYWLFIISNQDYQLQIKTQGEKVFNASLLRMLRTASTYNRKIILLAPPICRNILSRKMTELELTNIYFQPECNYLYFILLLYYAEYAFYWNMLSASFALRLINKKPTFFFSEGHVLKAFAPFKEFAFDNYYSSIKWPLLNQEEPLDLKSLKILTKIENHNFAKIIKSGNKIKPVNFIVNSLLEKH